MISRVRLSFIMLFVAAICNLVKGISAAYLLPLEEFGFYAVSISFTTIVVLLYSFSIEPRYLRSGARVLSIVGGGEAFDAHFFKYVSGLIWNVVFISFPIAIVMFFFDLSYGLILLILFSSFTFSLFNLSIASLRLNGKFLYYSNMLLYRGLTVILVYLLIPNDLKTASVFIALDAFICFIGFLFVNRSRLYRQKLRMIPISFYLNIIKSGWGYSSSYLSRTGLLMLDRPVVNLVQGNLAAGIFAIYLIPSQIAFGLLGLVSVYIQPWALACNNSGGIHKIKRFVRIYMTVCSVVSVSICVFLFYFYDFIQNITSFEFDKTQVMLSVAVSMFIVLNILDSFFLVFGKGRAQFFLSLINAFGYCLILLTYYALRMDFVFLLWGLFSIRFFTLVYSYFYIKSVIEKKMVLI